jgi:hypothetical protein
LAAVREEEEDILVDVVLVVGTVLKALTTLPIEEIVVASRSVWMESFIICAYIMCIV